MASVVAPKIIPAKQTILAARHLIYVRLPPLIAGCWLLVENLKNLKADCVKNRRNHSNSTCLDCVPSIKASSFILSQFIAIVDVKNSEGLISFVSLTKASLRNQNRLETGNQVLIVFHGAARSYSFIIGRLKTQ